MRTKCFVSVMSLLFLLGLSGNVLAVNDSTGDSLVPNVDILSSSVVTSNVPGDGQTTPDTFNLGIKMNTGSHLPGAVIWDFDADNDTATGGGSIVTGIPSVLCSGAPCKADAGGGFDFFVVLILRSQSDTSTLSDCSNCIGSSATCLTRGAAASCTEGTCYGIGDPCQIGDSDCYEQTTQCTGCAPFNYPLVDVCGSSASDCAEGYLKGQYFVGFGQGGTSTTYHGNVNLPFLYNMQNEIELCLELPWALLAVDAWVEIRDSGIGTVFNLDGLDLPPKFQVAAYYDEDFADEDDLFTRGPFSLDIADWMPDTARVADGEHNQFDPCAHNSWGGYGNVNVDANDVGDFVQEFGRSVFSRPCPTCKN